MTPREELLAEWYRLQKVIEDNKEKMKPTYDREMELRKFLLKDIWGDQLREGTNNWEAGGGFILKGTYKIKRKVIEETVPAVREKLLQMRVSPDTIFHYSPELVLKVYRGLTEEQRKVVDHCLLIEPAAPSLELVLPKDK